MTSDPFRHEPFELRQGSDLLIVATHGVAASPYSFRPLAEQLTQRLPADFVTVLLPGHGAGTRAFAAATAEDWRTELGRVLDREAGAYRRVLLLGHSLGGLLSLEAAARRGDVDGVVAVGTPMEWHLGWFQIRMALHTVFRIRETDPVLLEYRRADSISVRCPLAYVLWVLPLLRVLRLARAVRRRLPEVSCPVLAIRLERDETASRRSVNRIRKGLAAPCRVRVIPGARHFGWSRDMVARMASEIAEWAEDIGHSGEQPAFRI